MYSWHIRRVKILLHHSTKRCNYSDHCQRRGWQFCFPMLARFRPRQTFNSSEYWCNQHLRGCGKSRLADLYPTHMWHRFHQSMAATLFPSPDIHVRQGSIALLVTSSHEPVDRLLQSCSGTISRHVFESTRVVHPCRSWTQMSSAHQAGLTRTNAVGGLRYGFTVCKCTPH